MKKYIGKSIITGLLLSAFAVTSSFAVDRDMSKDELVKVKNEYSKLLGSPVLTLNKGIDHGKFKQIEVEAKGRRGSQKFNVFVVNGVEGVAFFGKAFTKDGKPFDFPKDSSLIKNGVAFIMGNGTEDIYLVSDPECPWCQKLEKEISSEARAKYKIHMIPMPLAMHPNSKSVLYWVMSAKTDKEKSERLHNYMTGKDKTSWKSFKPTDKQKTEIDKTLASSLKAAEELEARGTPSIYNKDFGKMSFKDLTK